MLSSTGNKNAAATGQWTLGFTNAAAYAELIDKIWLLDVLLYSPSICDSYMFEFDSLFRGRTVLLADYAGNSLGERQTDILIEPGMANFHPMFICDGQFSNCSGWTDLPTHGAVKFTIAAAGSQIR